jgi:hypothetical protein
MNGIPTDRQKLRLDRRFVLRSSTVMLMVAFAMRCAGATTGTDSAAPATVPPASPSSCELNQTAVSTAPVRYREFLTLLGQTERVNPALVEAVSTTLNHPPDSGQVMPQRPPSLMVVTYRDQTATQVRDVVVQLYFDPLAGDANVLNNDGYVRARLGDELSGSADQLLGLMYHQVVYFGPHDQVAHQERAFQAALNGDMTLLREQTIDPLRVLIVMPHGGSFLPSSLRSRVNGLVVDASLSFGAWSGKIGLVTADGDSAEQVATIMAAWREMALSLADTFAGHSSGKQLRESLKSSSVQVVANRVVASVSVDSHTIVRVSKEITGHGGGCPPGGACGRDKVCMCHKIDSRHEQTMCYSPTEVAGHMAQGDRCGPCEGDGDGGGHR